MTSNILVAPAKNNIRLMALSFNPENEEYTKENCLEQLNTVLKSTVQNHNCFEVCYLCFMFMLFTRAHKFKIWALMYSTEGTHKKKDDGEVRTKILH